MTSLAIDGPLDAADDLPDDLFDKLAPSAPVAAKPAISFDHVTVLPSLKGFEDRLAGIQDALNDARRDAASLRAELRHQAELLRSLAAALENV